LHASAAGDLGEAVSTENSPVVPDGDATALNVPSILDVA